ncbi:MAG TPA: GAF and ANTAR domain-containing protein [Actinomycetota bacterium]|nr:GAF and ANTAR domain-containing protein [Actinomycetota bacterium]
MDRPSGQVEQPLNSLAELQLSDQTLDAILGRIGALALQTLPGWDAVGASVVERDRVATFGTSDERINPVDQAQYDGGGGPCLDSITDGQFKYFNGDDIEPRWRQFAEVAADAEVYSVASFPLKLDGEVMGALNLYSRERDALRNGQREEGMLFAAQAAVTLANAKALIEGGEKVDQLEEALETRTMIGQATGLLMAQEGLSSDEAFQKLVQVSQNSNLKLRDIAQRYVAGWETKARRTQDT